MQQQIVSFIVGEEDEVSIKEAADMIIEAMEFTGEVQVSLSYVKPEQIGSKIEVHNCYIIDIIDCSCLKLLTS